MDEFDRGASGLRSVLRAFRGWAKDAKHRLRLWLLAKLSRNETQQLGLIGVGVGAAAGVLSVGTWIKLGLVVGALTGGFVWLKAHDYGVRVEARAACEKQHADALRETEDEARRLYNQQAHDNAKKIAQIEKAWKTALDDVLDFNKSLDAELTKLKDEKSWSAGVTDQLRKRGLKYNEKPKGIK